MAYNSDGYIMFDFSGVDFRRTTQTIEGIYKRCVEIIGTNKFILVINANGKTPLPSVCSFVNNQYVIESCIYTFAITSADLIIIKRNDPSELINDDIISNKTTYSSSKLMSVLQGYDIKMLEYTGTGNNTSTITFTSKPKFILYIIGPSDPGAYAKLDPFYYGDNISISWRILNDSTNAPSARTAFITYEDNDNIMHVTSTDQYRALNRTGNTYRVYYI